MDTLELLKEAVALLEEAEWAACHACADWTCCPWCYADEHDNDRTHEPNCKFSELMQKVKGLV